MPPLLGCGITLIRQGSMQAKRYYMCNCSFSDSLPNHVNKAELCIFNGGGWENLPFKEELMTPAKYYAPLKQIKWIKICR
jgi:hypothetical protein